MRALESINISATVTETIKKLHFEDGDVVKKGQLLAELDDTAEQAMLASAKAQLAEPTRETERLRNLVKSGAVSEVRLQTMETQVDVAEQMLEEMQAQMSDRRIEAPFDGVLGFRMKSDGALVSPGDVITTIDVVDPVRYDFTVPETFLSGLKPGLETIAHSDAWPGVEFKGKVTQIESRVNPVTRSLTVRSEIPNKENKLRPGMLMTTVLKKNVSDSLSVPERALVAVQRNQFVFVIEEADGKKISKRTPVKVGRRKPGVAEILEGIEEGQQVVTDGLIGIRDGGEVEVIGEFQGPAEAFTPDA